MRKLTQIFLLAGVFLLALQSAWAFSLIGPAVGGDAAWQTTDLGFNPLAAPNPTFNPFGNPNGIVGQNGNPSGVTDPYHTYPKNLGEEYRRNTPVMYYTFDQNFVGYFGSDGTNAVAQAFDILNALTNVDNYSSGLTEFPLQSSSVNYTAQGLELIDLKSLTLASLMQQLGLEDAVRYTWLLHSRWHVGTPPCPAGEEYFVTERNFDIAPTPLNQVQYTPYVNGSLYTYTIFEGCGLNPNPYLPVVSMAIPYAADSLNANPPIASGLGFGGIEAGQFYTGLTRDDVAGFRYLLKASTINTESPTAGALLQTPTGSSTAPFFTRDLGNLISVALVTDPVTLSNEFPGLIISGVTTNYNVVNWQTNIVTYITNLNGSAIGSPVLVTTTSITPTFAIVTNYSYSFANVITNSYTNITTAIILTTSNMPPTGSAFGSGPGIPQTSSTKVTIKNVPSGDYYIIPAGTCGFSLLNLLGTITNSTTNAVISTTNAAGFFFSQALVTQFIQHVYNAQQTFCSDVTPTAGQYEGIERMQFVHIDHNQYDTLTGLFYAPITNTYKMSLYVPTNNTVTIQTFQRVVTSPDFLFSAKDETLGSVQNIISLTDPPNWNESSILPGLSGPGTIDPTPGSPGNTIAFNTSGTLALNIWPQVNGPNDASIIGGFTYASFDGTTNTPVVYPNGTSIQAIENGVFIQLFPSNLPVATNGIPYSATFTVTGGQSPYTWSLAAGSLLPTGLTLSSGGVLSGTATQSGTFDFVVQMSDSASHIVQENYTLTIN
jgi:hypothetical protein